MQKRQYKIASAIGNRYLNSFVMQYYSLTDTKSVPENEIRLTRIVG